MPQCSVFKIRRSWHANPEGGAVNMVRHLGEGDCKITVHGLYEQASRTKFKQMKEKAESVGKLACINSDSLDLVTFPRMGGQLLKAYEL